MENYISTSEAKKRLACSAQTVRNLIKSGKLEAVQMESGRFLIDEISLQNYQLDQSKGVRVAKDAKAKTKFLPNVKPKLIENSGNQLATEIKEQLGTRPEWLHLYQTLIDCAVTVNTARQIGSRFDSGFCHCRPALHQCGKAVQITGLED